MPRRNAPEVLPGNGPRVRAPRKVSLAALVLVLSACAATLLFNSRAASLPAPGAIGEQTGGQQANLDFSRFAHTNQHAQLPCLLCHRREGTGAQPRLPGHTPCSGCHAQQFQDQSHPICTICHTQPPAKDLKPFPPLRSFTARFNHARHTSGAARPAAGCVACHRPAQRGVALSIPAGLAAHNTCYQCHGPRAQTAAGDDISSCGTCHSLGRLTRTPTSAHAYRVNFSHAKHTAKVNCADCHNVRAGTARGQQVSAPQPLMHHARPGGQSCMTCHNGRRAFGGDDFTVCTRCHTGPAWHF